MVNVSKSPIIQCKICREDVKENLTFLCTCRKRVCEKCWKSVMCIDCFDKLPYDKKELVDNLDLKFIKKRKITKIIFYILLFFMPFGSFILHFPIWTIFVQVGFMILFSILYYFVPLFRSRKKLGLN